MPWMSSRLLLRWAARGGRGGVAWETTEDIPHTGISVDVALGHDGSLVDRTGGFA